MRADEHPAPAAPVTFESWARLRQNALRRTAFLLCGDWDRAQDLAQETLTRMYRVWPRLTDPATAEAYARRVLTNAYIDAGRRLGSRERPLAAVPDRPGPDGPDVPLRVTLLAALARMPRSQRSVLVLRYWEDLSTAQTAQALGCSEGTVKSQASRGLVALRAELAARGVDLDLGTPTAVDDDGPGVAGAVPPRAPSRADDGRGLGHLLAVVLGPSRGALLAGAR